MTALTYELVLFLNGRSARRPVLRDPHTGEPYCHAKNAAGIDTRVYVVPGESVTWVERGTGRSVLGEAKPRDWAPPAPLAA